MPDKVVIRLINPRSPSQIEDRAPEPIVVYHWHRIIAALVVVVLLLGGVVAGMRHVLKTSDGAGELPVEQVSLPDEKPNTAAPSAAVQATLPAAELPNEPKPSSSTAVQKPEPASSQPAKVHLEAATREAARADAAPSSRALIRSRNIRRAQLTSNVVDDEPVDELGAAIPMNGRGLLKVFLYMETAGLKGRVLFHDWYWKDKLIARVRVPVTQNAQNAATSKFIDRIMTGPWQVKVVDERKKVYAEVSFQVR
ncbi:MAG: hypothetical protein H6R26_2924 [Proteobacteria bacterium]|nr:hypothetical protein [Pseudomonadota bacterium]